MEYNNNGNDKFQTTEPVAKYANTDELRKIFEELHGKKFMLDCEPKVTFGYFLANDITIRTGKKVEIICSQCGY